MRQVAVKEPDAHGNTTQFELQPVCRETLFEFSNDILHFGKMLFCKARVVQSSIF